MCGIIGFVGSRPALPLLVEGLRRLEYRGYDSAGVAFLLDGKVEVRRCAGKLSGLEQVLDGDGLRERAVEGIGIGHTRWATHGRPSEENAHPHRAGAVVVVHNGIIENYLSLKRELLAEGRIFLSETDTEVIAQLIDRSHASGKPLAAAVREALFRVKGSYAICVFSEREPDRLVAARNGCPLVIGVAPHGYFLASDIPAFLSQTREVIFLEDGEVAVATSGSLEIVGPDGSVRKKQQQQILWDPVAAEKGGYRHFMQKEIHEQPRAITDTFRGRIFPESGEVELGEIPWSAEEVRDIERVSIAACGTSWHAALIGKFLIEEIARLPVEVDIASEFRYRDPLIDAKHLFIAVSQSGETADTLAALKEAKGKGARLLSICNVVGSSLAREADGVLFTHAGPEISVASTKAFTTQIVALYLLALYLGRKRGSLSKEAARLRMEELVALPGWVERVLQQEEEIARIARKFLHASDFLYLGRGINYPIALEGALKLKEISYIHAEGYPAGEMKHGPIALIDREMPVVVLVPHLDPVYEKIASNVMEVKARGGIIIALVQEGDPQVAAQADEKIFIPAVNPKLIPILLVVPLQLLAYHIATLRGSDVDQPRNLAKSVTVE
jgi:glucosamine--fructose-6-phosphate aminotransferase (isomerizing)